jgi:ankyrin repeat protein
MSQNNEMNDWYEKEKLHFAVQENDLEKVKKLIDEGCDPNYFDDISFTPLHYAIQNENLDIAQYLIDHGSDVNACENEKAGNTPLAEVAQECSVQTAQFLIQKGADPTIPGWMHLTALDRAKKRKKPEGKKIYNLLLDRAKNPIKYKFKT